MPNVDLLHRTFAHIEAHPEEWNQGEWVCGTRMCFAGHAATLSGVCVTSDFIPVDTLPEALRSDYAGRNSVHVAQLAANLLEISEEGDWTTTDEWGVQTEELPSEADRLFYGDNSLEDLRVIVAELCGDVVTVPAQRAGSDAS